MSPKLYLHPVAWLGFALFVGFFIRAGSVLDTDHAAQAHLTVSVFSLFARLTSAFHLQWPVLILYALVTSGLMAYQWIRRRYTLFIFFLNPFVWANSTDVFNRFVLSMIVAQLAELAIERRNLLFAALTMGTFATMHPFNAIAVGAGTLPIASPAAMLIVTNIDGLLHSHLLESLFPDKFALYRGFGGSLAMRYAGNFQIDNHILVDSGRIPWFFAVSIPGIGLRVPTITGYLVAGYSIIWYFLVFCFTRFKFRTWLPAISMLMIISVMVGNSAVAARHFLPILYLFLAALDQPSTEAFWGLAPWSKRSSDLASPAAVPA